MPAGFQLDSRTLLAGEGYPTLPSGHAKTDIHGHPFGTSDSEATLKEIEMKQLLIVLTLVVASAAPAMADSFPNLYQTNR